MNIDDFFEPDELDNTPDVIDEITSDEPAPPHTELEQLTTEEKPNSIEEIDETAVSYFNFLKEYKVLNTNDDFEFDGSSDAIEKALNQTRENTVKQVRDEIWNSLPEDFKPLLEYGLSGGNSLESYLSAFTPIDYDNVDIEDTISQKQVITEYWKQHSNYTDEKIANMISKLERSDSLRESAEEALVDLKEFKETRRNEFLSRQAEAVASEKAAIAASTRALEDAVTSYTDDSKRVDRLKHFIFTPIRENNSTTTEFSKVLSNIEKNHTHLIQLADILADYNPNTGFSFDRIKKQLKSESAKSFRELLDSKLQRSPIKGNEQRQNVAEELDWDTVFGK
jgi:hypothetical protein